MVACCRSWVVYRVVVLQHQRRIAAPGLRTSQGSAISTALHGQQLELLPNTKVRNGDAKEMITRRKQHLLLAFETGCSACKRNLPAWERLLSEAAWRANTDVLLLNYKGTGGYDRIFTILHSRGIRYSVLGPTSHVDFGVLTGVVAVPTTLVLDQSMCIRLVHTGPISERVFHHFSRAVGAGRRPIKGNGQIESHN